MDRFEFGVALCEALGEKGELVKSIDLHFDSEGEYTATIIKRVKDNSELIQIIKKADWVDQDPVKDE